MHVSCESSGPEACFLCVAQASTVAVGPSVLCVLYAVLRLSRRAVGPGVRHTPQCLSIAAPALGLAWPWSPRVPHLHERRMDILVQPGAHNLMSNRMGVLCALMILVDVWSLCSYVHTYAPRSCERN